jgi:GntR family transcriptional regulator
MSDVLPRPPRSVGGSSHGRHTSTRRVRDIIRAGIGSGLSFSQDSLTEDFLMRELGASRNSVREALQMLADEGLLDRRRRVGTSISGSIVDIPVTDMVTHRLAGELGIRWVEERIEPVSRYVREQLRLPAAHDEVKMIEYVFTLHGDIVGVRSIYVESTHTIVETPIAMHLEDAFDYAFGAPLGQVVTTLAAETCDSKTARLLRVAEGSAILVSRQLMFDASGRPRELAFTHFRADRVNLSHTQAASPA